MKEQILEFLSRIFKLIFGRIIIFEDVNGFNGNSGAVYNYMINDSRFNKYNFVWLVKELTPYNTIKRERTRTFLFTSNNLYKKICRFSADYIIFDNIKIKKKRKNQVSIFLTHGCPPFKNVRGIIDINSIVDFVLCPSYRIKDLICYQYSVDEVKLFYNGLPRNDYLFKPDARISEKYGFDKYSKVIIWMPTFRKHKYVIDRVDSSAEFPYGIPLIKNCDDVSRLSKLLKDRNMLLIIKSHPISSEDFTPFPKCDNIITLNDMELLNNDINYYSMLGMTDALITDYSSVLFDYLMINKPVCFTIDDIDEYNFGFAFDNPLDYMPGDKVKDLDGLCDFFVNLSNGIDKYEKERIKLRDQTQDFVDDKNTERFINRFFNKEFIWR